MMRATTLLNMAVFIIELILLYLLYVHEGLRKHLENSIVLVMMGVYVAGSLGNIIEMNMLGWVTDYMYFLPAYGFKASSNLEDWLTWGVQGWFVIYVGVNWAVYVVNWWCIRKSKRKAV